MVGGHQGGSTWAAMGRKLLTSAGLDGITALPDHGADGTAEHV